MSQQQKDRAVQAAVNATAEATRVINEHGRNSLQGRIAFETAKVKAREARALGATDADFRATRPA